MSFIFGGSKQPEIRTVTPPKLPAEKKSIVTTPSATPPTTKEEQTKIVEEEKKKITKGKKRRGTILTGPRGILTKPKVERKTLLGE